MWQLIQKFTKSNPDTLWYYQSSQKAADETVYMDTWVLNHIRADLGDSATFEYTDTVAQATITIQDLERAYQFVEELSNEQVCQEYFKNMLTYGRSMGNQQLTNVPEFPDIGFVDIEF